MNLNKKSISQLKKQADKLCSDYIRQRDKGICITCGNKKEWKYQQAGHYISRIYLNLRYFEKNIHCQCYSCNVMKHGNMDEYAIQLQKKYGSDILETLHTWKQMPSSNSTRLYLCEVIERYKKLLGEIKKAPN